MCFLGRGRARSVAPAPDAPEAPPEEEDIGTARAEEEDTLYGKDGPDFRVDRSTGGVTGGSGLRM